MSQSKAFTKNNPAVIRSWCMYDWANSVYSLIITSTLFPVYFNMVAVNEQGGSLIEFAGISMPNSALFSYAVSFSFLLAGLMSPLLSAYADVSGFRRRFLMFFCLMGAFCCAAMFFFVKGNLEFGMLMFVLAAFGFSSSIVFYNSFLPEIVSPDLYDKVSARGFAMGYIGSVLLLIIILLPLFVPVVKLDMGEICRIGFVLTGLWWFGFGLKAVTGLPSSDKGRGLFFELGPVWLRVASGFQISSKIPGLARYLAGFFFMNMGVQTIMYLAAIFGEVELKMSSEKLIATILILQLVAIGGSILFARVSTGLQPIGTLILACFLWIGVCIAAYFVQTDNQFFAVAALVGLVMGGSQSMLRSTFTHYLPKDEHGKSVLYGFYDLLEKFSIVFGTFAFGITNQITGNMRISALVLVIFFVLGIFFFRRKPVALA